MRSLSQTLVVQFLTSSDICGYIHISKTSSQCFFLWFLASVSKPAPDKPAEKSGGFVTQRRVTDVYFGPTSLSALPTRTTNSILVLQSFDMQVSCAECSGLKL